MKAGLIILLVAALLLIGAVASCGGSFAFSISAADMEWRGDYTDAKSADQIASLLAGAFWVMLVLGGGGLVIGILALIASLVSSPSTKPTPTAPPSPSPAGTQPPVDWTETNWLP